MPGRGMWRREGHREGKQVAVLVGGWSQGCGSRRQSVCTAVPWPDGACSRLLTPDVIVLGPECQSICP